MAIDPPFKPRRQVRRTLPAVWMRAGTSKGLFLHKRDLPPKREQWSPIILAAMGSADADPRQLNGIAGATSTTSKVAVVSPSSKPGVDVEYTFIQVSIGSAKLDFTGNCGNIAAGVGPFAIDEGLVKIPSGSQKIDVRILNTNTGRVIVETLEVDNAGHFAEDGDYVLPGTFSAGSQIGVAFERPAGAMTGRLLPSGSVTNTLYVPGTVVRPTCEVRASLVDAANPFVLVDASTIPASLRDQDPHSSLYLDFIEDVRREGAVQMGLAHSVEAAARVRGTPKIAVLSPPSGTDHVEADLKVTSFSMGKVHGSLQLTGAVCLAAAACTAGTTANRLAMRFSKGQGEKSLDSSHRSDSLTDVQQSIQRITLQHPTGTITAEVTLDGEDIESVRVSRTARRLFEGNVCFMSRDE